MEYSKQVFLAHSTTCPVICCPRFNLFKRCCWHQNQIKHILIKINEVDEHFVTVLFSIEYWYVKKDYQIIRFSLRTFYSASYLWLDLWKDDVTCSPPPPYADCCILCHLIFSPLFKYKYASYLGAYTETHMAVLLVRMGWSGQDKWPLRVENAKLNTLNLPLRKKKDCFHCTNVSLVHPGGSHLWNNLDETWSINPVTKEDREIKKMEHNKGIIIHSVVLEDGKEWSHLYNLKIHISKILCGHKMATSLVSWKKRQDIASFSLLVAVISKSISVETCCQAEWIVLHFQ